MKMYWSTCCINVQLSKEVVVRHELGGTGTHKHNRPFQCLLDFIMYPFDWGNRLMYYEVHRWPCWKKQAYNMETVILYWQHADSIHAFWWRLWHTEFLSKAYHVFPLKLTFLLSLPKVASMVTVEQNTCPILELVQLCWFSTDGLSWSWSKLYFQSRLFGGCVCLLALAAGQVLVLRVVNSGGETLCGLPVTLTDEMLTLVVVVGCQRKMQGRVSRSTMAIYSTTRRTWAFELSLSFCFILLQTYVECFASVLH